MINCDSLKKEIPCTSCGHQNVCSLRTNLFKVQDEINNIGIPEDSYSDQKVCRIPLRSIDWLEVSLICAHRTPLITKPRVNYVDDSWKNNETYHNRGGVNMANDKELRKNASGYSDPTAYEAIKNVEVGIEDDRFHKLLHTIFDICELSDFRLEGRITLVDQRTGKEANELIIIMPPGRNRGIKEYPKEYEEALRLAEKYKYVKYEPKKGDSHV